MRKMVKSWGEKEDRLERQEQEQGRIEKLRKFEWKTDRQGNQE